MSPSKDMNTSDLPAYMVYNSMKSKRKRNKKPKNKTRNTEEILITEEESEVEEIISDHEEPSSSRPSTSGNVRFKKKRKSNGESCIATAKQTNVVNGFEVVDIEENSNEVQSVETLTKGKKKKRSVYLNLKDDDEDDDDDVIIEAISKDTLSDSSSSNPVISLTDDIENENQDSQEDTHTGNSIVEGLKLLKYVINPVIPADFFKNTWERRPLHIKRGMPEFYKTFISTPMIDKVLRTCNMQFSKHVDVTSYSDGKRDTYNPVGRALPSIVWDYYNNGCSVRLLNPQSFFPKLTLLNASLQEYFGCFVGANAYLTPPNSQGFAPHYDDIEAFVLQVEGKKQWKLYSPREKSETLPRFSSENFNQEEIGEPIMDVTVRAGDLLYFPRGTIHQGRTVPGSHSLHITLSCYQRNTWGDLLEKVVTGALQQAMENNLEFRKGLPVDYLSYMGLVHSDKSSPQRTEFIEKIKNLMGSLIEEAPIDAAVDQMGKQFMHDALPPVLTEEERMCSSLGDGYKMGQNGKLSGIVQFSLATRIKLLRAHILRLVREEDTVRLYHSMDNSLEYHGEEPQFLEITSELAPAIEHLICSYPEFVQISELPLSTEAQKVTIVGDLWDRGLLLTDGPLPKIEED